MTTESRRARGGRLQRDSAVPLYVQIADLIDADIARGRLGPRSRLPSENELMARFGVSRITVRGAIARLAKAGVVEARQGKGTFVAGPVVRHGLDRLTGFYDEMLSQGLRPRRELIEYRRALAAETQGTPFSGRSPAPMLVKRLYVLDGQPFAVVVGLLLPEAERLTQADAAERAIYELLAMLHLDIARADIGIRVRSPGADVGRRLGLAARRQVLQMQRSSFGTDGTLLEHSLFFISPEAYEFRLSVAGPVTIGSGIRRLDPVPAGAALAFGD